MNISSFQIGSFASVAVPVHSVLRGVKFQILKPRIEYFARILDGLPNVTVILRSSSPR